MRVEFKSDGDAPGAFPPARARGVGPRLAAALQALAGGQATLVEHRQRAWASVTFSGARHEVTLAFAGTTAIEAGEHLIAEASEHEFGIPGQLVADVAVLGVDHVLAPEPRMTVRLEVLTLEDA
jgi:hypothetical protein